MIHGVNAHVKQIIDLESEVNALKEELRLSPAALKRKNNDKVNWIPKTPTYYLESHRGSIECLAFHPIYSLIASGSEDCTIKIWDWEHGHIEKTIRGHHREITGLDFGGSQSNVLLASCSTDMTIKIWDPSKGYVSARTLVGHNHSVSSVRFLRFNDSSLASCGRDGSIRIWDTSNGACVRTISTDSDWVRDISPSFDGRWIVSAGSDCTAIIWETSSGKAQSFFRGHEQCIECCAFAPPASYSYLAAMARMKTVPPMSSSGEFVATGGRDRTIKVWHARGQLIQTLMGHESWVRGLVFHPSGRFLLSVGDDGTIRSWDLTDRGKLRATTEDQAGFVSCIRWVPAYTNQTSELSKASRMGEKPGVPETRCVLATGGTDKLVRIFM